MNAAAVSSKLNLRHFLQQSRRDYHALIGKDADWGPLHIVMPQLNSLLLLRPTGLESDRR